MPWPLLTERLRAAFQRAADVVRSQNPQIRASIYFDSSPSHIRYHAGLYFFRPDDEEEILSCEVDVYQSPDTLPEVRSTKVDCGVDTINFSMASGGTTTRRPQLIEMGATQLAGGIGEQQYVVAAVAYSDRVSAFIDANMDFVLHNVGPDE